MIEEEDELLEKDYYTEHPEYSSVKCIQCGNKMRLLGIHSHEDKYDSSQDFEKELYCCEKCGQKAYIEIEWLFTIQMKKIDR